MERGLADKDDSILDLYEDVDMSDIHIVMKLKPPYSKNDKGVNITFLAIRAKDGYFEKTEGYEDHSGYMIPVIIPGSEALRLIREHCRTRPDIIKKMEGYTPE